MHFYQHFVLFGFALIATVSPSGILAAGPSGRSSKSGKSIIQRALDALKKEQSAAESKKVESTENSETQEDSEVAETIEALKLADKMSEQTRFGTLRLDGVFATTEISGCWTDVSVVSGGVEIHQVGKMLFGISDQVIIHHDTGARCGTSDQGPMVTDTGTAKLYALGFEDEEEGGYTLMLEGTDRTHWTLKSGGEVGTASFLRFYTPHLYADAKTGGFGGFTITHDQVANTQHLLFKGEVAGSGSRTNGRMAVILRLGTDAITEAESKAQVDFNNEQVFGPIKELIGK